MLSAIKANRVFKYLASVRFAIPVMVAWAAAMIVGTIAESLRGTEYARVAVYHSTWFYAIQGAIALSLFLAMVARFPLKARLTGFYTVHIALLVVMAGSVITRYRGIDGTIQLSPDQPSASVMLEEDRMILTRGSSEKTLALPVSNSPVDLDETVVMDDGTKVALVKYLPYAKPATKWVKEDGAWISQWLLKSPRAEQRFELSNRPTEDIPDRVEAGAMRVELAEAKTLEPLVAALSGKAKGDLVLIRRSTGDIASVPSLEQPATITFGADKLTLKMVENKKISLKVYVLETPQGEQKFFPRFSAAPISNHMQIDLSSDFRLMSLESYRAMSTVLLGRSETGEVLIAFGKGTDWKLTSYKKEPVALPWMGFNIELVSERTGEIAVSEFEPGVASKKAEENVKAVLVRLEKGPESEEAWLTDRSEGGFRSAGVMGRIGKKAVSLPFSMTLDRFKMDMVPRMNEPASYESFVRVAGVAEPVHIYMNHPYKSAGYTFYQSSYFQDEGGRYHSVLSVNKDPGRPVKYLGSILLVLGLILHFMTLYGYFPIRRRSEERATGTATTVATGEAS